ncbi:hypothetical protein F2Q69_00012873 [Brassica cretica]|uniref:Uncharacterized protein n=1 Tax=Brassica cretica TaxID=69181 RepID=A0A8S9R7M4_BRACR|nr:hypothetical protein F2Q69_00012873 [Brassica cretica]
MFLAMSKARADLVSLVHAQQYQKQQENSTAILTRSCKFGTFDPQGNTLLIDRQHHLCVARFCSTTVDPDTSSVDRYSLTTVDRNTHLPSTNILHLTSINTPSQTSIDTEPRDMVAPLILARDNNGDMHDQDGHLRNAEGQRIDAQGAAIPGPHANATGTTLPVDEAAQPRTKRASHRPTTPLLLSLDSVQPPSTQTLVPSTDTRSPLSTDNTHLPSTNILHPTSIDRPSQTSIDTEPPDMVAPLILVRDNNGDLHDQEGHLRNAAVVKEEKLQEGDFEVESLMNFGGSQWCRSTQDLEHRSTYTSPYRSTTPTESTTSCNAVKILTHEEFAAKHPHPPSPDKVRIARRADNSINRHGESSIDRHSEAAIDRQTPAPIDRRAPITYRVQMPKIDVARLNALRPKPKPSEYPPEPVSTPSDDGEDPMEDDRVPTGRTLRRRKGKVAKHLKR